MTEANPNRIGSLMEEDKGISIASEQPVAPINVATYTPPQPRFTIRCQKCRWAEVNGGTSPELSHLHEIKSGCQNCGKSRQFRCPKCSRHATMNRVKGA